MKNASVTSNAATAISKPIILDEPIKRGDTFISEVTIRRPKSGELRGVSLMDLGNMSVAALQTVLPRITQPTLTAHEVAGMDPADLTEIGAEVAIFLVKKADRLAAFRTE
ncbi:phage tail assembly protein [Collimonas pratensis]|uniref:phage tail assembly protein n=1 Tax=Collimonas pratensis TaxID=279113 RepID=UPI00143CD7B7|nr:phage tail assembly protein [Collimonas pratensis]NKI68099.1 phage tail assembly protein [Collimonas pratensis]